MKNHILQLTRYTGQQVTDYEPSSYLAKNENRNGDFDVFDPDQNWTGHNNINEVYYTIRTPSYFDVLPIERNNKIVYNIFF